MCVRAGLDSLWSRGAFLGISPQLLSASGMEKKKKKAIKMFFRKDNNSKVLFQRMEGSLPTKFIPSHRFL